MLNRLKIGTAAIALTLGLAMPVGAQQNGLVNVKVQDLINGDVLSNNKVSIGVAANVAAAVCAVAQVGVIARQVASTGEFDCTNPQATQLVQITR